MSDFGLTEGINQGCIDSYQNGILTEMSLMMDSPATNAAAKLASENIIKGVGIHITLNDIVGTGRYLRTDDYKNLLENSSEKELSNRVNDELKKFEDLLGRIPTHINGHKNCYLHPKIIDTVSEYASKNNIYVRRYKPFSDGNSAGQDVNAAFVKNKIKITDYIFEHIVGTYDEALDGFVNDLKTLEDNTTTEIFFHPGIVDDQLRSYSSLLDDRERDLKLLKDSKFKNELINLGFNICGFSEIK